MSSTGSSSDLRILLIDNHDSYTYNLYQYLSSMTMHPVDVMMNDAHPTYDEYVTSLDERIRRRRSRDDDGSKFGKNDDVSADGTTMGTADETTTTTTTTTTSLSDHYDCVILSPGPGRPSRPSDVGIMLDVIRRNPTLPILGVCLGHQALGYAYGRTVTLAPCGPVHGMLSSVFHDEGRDLDDDDDDDIEGNDEHRDVPPVVGYEDGTMRRVRRDADDHDSGGGPICRLFRGLPQGFDVVRYHSLVVDFSSSSTTTSNCEGNDGHRRSCDDTDDLEPIAWSTTRPVEYDADGTTVAADAIRNGKTIRPEDHHSYGHDAICMALRHRRYPHYGVQFHPESIGTGYPGYRILRNFCDFVIDYSGRVGKILHPIHDDKDGESNEKIDENGAHDEQSDVRSKFRVFIHRVENHMDRPLPMPRKVFEDIYSSRPNSFWLDSSTGGGKVRDGPDILDDEGCPIASNSRFSIMGSNDGPLSRKIEFFGREHDVERRGLRVLSNELGETEGEESVGSELVDIDILSYLRRKLAHERELVDHVEIVAFDKSEESYDEVDATIPNSEYSLHRTEEFANEQKVEGGALMMHRDDELIVPFDYRGGYVGYLGYEVRHETQCRIFEREGGDDCHIATRGFDSTSSHADEQEGAISPCSKTNPSIPTASFLFADRSLVYDHQTGDWYMIGITMNDATTAHHVTDTISWMRSMKVKIKLMGGELGMEQMLPKNHTSQITEVSFVPNRSKEQYKDDISRSHEEIRNGESYELCLTNQLEAKLRFPPKQSSPTKATRDHESPFELYKLLRRRNPAPFSAFMNFYNDDDSLSQSQKNNTASVSICCSSPERFLSIKKARLTTPSTLHKDAKRPGQHRLPARQFVVESKPIKGTAARYAGTVDGAVESDEHVRLVDSQLATGLRESAKDRAENLMIVDLLRNDLGRVCQVGSVHVPSLMHIESYATVHQMVSTVRGTLDGNIANAIDVIEACFPGGSMTGAPKQRSMEILDEIERGVSRGPYSGCLGYISLNGCMDMNIVIRSAILTPSDDAERNEDGTETWKASVGCGGAITALSDSNDEYEEMLLKSRIVRRTISDWAAQTTEERNRHHSASSTT